MSSYCLGLTIHEIGHAIALSLAGASDIRIFVHPFSLSYYNNSSLPTDIMPFIGSMGPLFNLGCATTIILVLWRKRNPKLLPLLMWVGIAYFSEGVSIIMNISDISITSDWGKVIILGGISPIILGIIGVLFITLGCILILLLLPLENISPHDSIWRIGLTSIGFVFYFAFSLVYVLALDPINITGRLIALISALFLLIFITTSYKHVFHLLDRFSHTKISSASWYTVLIALGSGVAIIIIDFAFFY